MSRVYSGVHSEQCEIEMLMTADEQDKRKVEDASVQDFIDSGYRNEYDNGLGRLERNGPVTPDTECLLAHNSGEIAANTPPRETGTDQDVHQNPISRIVALANHMTRAEYAVAKLNTRLMEALEKSHTEEIYRLLRHDANPNATCGLDLVSACHVATMNKDESLSLLFNAGADCFRRDRRGQTTLHLAAWTGNPKHITLILNQQKDLQRKGVKKLPRATGEHAEGASLEQNLINQPCEGVTSALCDLPTCWQLSMDHNCQRIEGKMWVILPGWTALHAASARAQYDCVELLLAAGADPCALDLNNNTPLDVAGIAFHSKHHVDEYKKTVSILLRAGGKLNTASGKDLKFRNTPLHTALELRSDEALEVLLDSGVSVNWLNSSGLTVMHVCVEKQLKDYLQLLVRHDNKNVEATDSFGRTVLDAAVRAKWLFGVCIAIQAGASITALAYDGAAPIHSAVSAGDTDILREILFVAKKSNLVDFPNDRLYTPLFVAVDCKKKNAVKMLLDYGARADLVLLNDFNIFHLASQKGHPSILHFLLYRDKQITEHLIDIIDIATGYTPFVHAIVNDHLVCVRLLLKASKGLHLTQVKYKDDILNEEVVTTPLHIAVAKGNADIVRHILYYDFEAINKANSIGLLPLHEACHRGNRTIISLLLHEGADLSCHAKHHKIKDTHIDILMNHLSKPTEFMESVFDSCVSSEDMNLHDTQCKVIIDFSMLVSNSKEGNQMGVIRALVDTGNRYKQRRLLQHPLIESFLYLKWRALLPFYYVMIALYTAFVLSLNVYVVTGFYYQDKNKQNKGNDTESQVHITPNYLRTDVWKYIMYLTASVVALKELILLKIRNKRRYFRFLETWVKFVSIGLSILLPSIVSWPVTGAVRDTAGSPEWARLLATIALLSSWTGFMFLVSRFPSWGFYLLMFGKVARKVFKILLTFMFLIFGFSLCFMIQFRATPPFEDLWAAITKTLVMMTSEYDYTSMMNNEAARDMVASITILRLIFITFVILASIVVMNLLVGVAVNDVTNLEEIGKQNRLEKQVDFLASLEDIVIYHKDINKILPKRFNLMWSRRMEVQKCIIFRPRDATCTYNKILPPHIKEAIFEKAQLQKNQMNEKLGSMAYQMKLNEIHDAIVRQDDTLEQPQQNIDYGLFNETLNELRKEIDAMKQLLSKKS